jgi:F0F1-type ATP synthase membrane subunit c/vacuolar-type H+-ATPase subunit K
MTKKSFPTALKQQRESYAYAIVFGLIAGLLTLCTTIAIPFVAYNVLSGTAEPKDLQVTMLFAIGCGVITWLLFREAKRLDH